MLGVTELLGSVFGSTTFRGFSCFGRRLVFADFVARLFLLFSCPEKILQKNPQQNPIKNDATKLPDTSLQRGLGQEMQAFRGSCSLAGEGAGPRNASLSGEVTLVLWGEA